MLSRLQVDRLLRSGDLVLEYDLDPSAITGELMGENARVDPDSTDLKSTKTYSANYFGNRLSFTLGPLVLSHTHASWPGRSLYQNRPGVFDLRQSGGAFTIQPGESITVNTIEYIALGKKLGAITLPRLTHATAGIVLSASYVDPYWNGIMVFHMVNLSGEPFRLTIGEKIGACHFYEVDQTDLNDEFRVRFSQKSHHYGQRWREILAGDSDPFPMRKRPAPTESRFASAFGWARTNVKRIVLAFGGATAVTAIVGGIFMLGQVSSELDELRALPDKSNQQEEKIQDIITDLNNTKSKSTEGRVSVSFAVGQTVTSVTVPVAIKAGESPTGVLTETQSTTGQYRSEGEISSVQPGTTEVTVVVTRSSADTTDAGVQVYYVVGLSENE